MLSKSEAAILDLVNKGVFEIHSDGTIWRLRYENISHNIYIKKKSLPARAEYYNIGYLEVRTSIDGISYRAKAHRIVWIYFRGDIPDGLQINHINGKRDDNMPENLEVVNTSQNITHAYKIGLAHGRPGMSHHLVKITDDDVRKIRELYSYGNISQSKLGEQFGLSQTHVGRIIRGTRWQSVK